MKDEHILKIAEECGLTQKQATVELDGQEVDSVPLNDSEAILRFAKRMLDSRKKKAYEVATVGKGNSYHRRTVYGVFTDKEVADICAKANRAEAKSVTLVLIGDVWHRAYSLKSNLNEGANLWQSQKTSISQPSASARTKVEPQKQSQKTTPDTSSGSTKA